MIRPGFVLTAAALVLTVAVSVSGQDVHGSIYHDYRVVTVADGLEIPWSMAWLPGGDMLVTERPGRLRIIRNGKLLSEPVPGVPEVFARGQGGLFDVVPHPDFASNRLLYLSFAKPNAEGSTTAVVRGRFENDRLNDVEEIFEAVAQGRGHYGGRLAFDRNNYLFITAGDRMVPSTGNLEAHPAQDTSNHHGVTIRLHDDGRVPDDNPSLVRPRPVRRSGVTGTGICRAWLSTPRPATSGSRSTARKGATSSTGLSGVGTTDGRSLGTA